MQKLFKRAGLATAAVTALALAAPAHAVSVIGLTTTNALISFDSATPTNASSLNFITGLQAPNERLLSIDLRPTTGLLYGVSSASKVYTLTADGSATFVATLGASLIGEAVGIDFNPAADLAGMASLRIVSSSGQNLAFNANNGATTVATGVQTGFSAVAYANNDTSPATGTGLYYIDAVTDELKFAATAFNNPTITTIGDLGFNSNGVAGFDIFGAAAGFAALTNADTGKSGLYTIDLGTGAATLVGEFGIGGNTAISPPLLGLTVAAIPEPSTYALMLAGLLGVGYVAKRRGRTRA